MVVVQVEEVVPHTVQNKGRLQYLQNSRKVVSDHHHLGQRCGEGSLPEFGGILEVQYATLMVEERSLRVVEPTTYVGGG